MWKFIRSIQLLLLGTGIVCAAFSEDISLSVEEAVVQALKVNFDVQKESYTLKKLQIAQSASWNVLVPTIVYTGALSKSNTIPEASLIDPDPNEWSLNHGLQLTVPLASLLAQNIIDVITPYKQYERGEINADQLLATVSVNVQKSYIDILVSELTVQYLTDKYASAQFKREEAAASFSDGLLDEYSYLQIQFLEIQAKQQLEQQINAHTYLSEQFAILLGYPTNTMFLLTDEIPEIESNDIQQWLGKESIENNHAIRTLAIQRTLNKFYRLKAYFGLIPRISLSWTTMYRFQEDPMVDPWFGGDWGDDLGSLTLTLSIPLGEYHPWSRSAVALRQFNQDIASLSLQSEYLHTTLTQKMDASKRNLMLAMEALAVQEKQVEITTRAFELAEEAYNNGLMKVSDYQDAQDNLYNAQLNVLTYKTDIFKNILDISLLIGDSKPSITTQGK